MEERNWKIIKFIAVIVVVFAVLFWVRTTIRNEFSRLSRENSLELARSVASVDPDLFLSLTEKREIKKLNCGFMRVYDTKFRFFVLIVVTRI